MTRRHGSAPGRVKHVEGGEIFPASGTRDRTLTVMGLGMEAPQES
jgi:hypothetical protein